MQPTVLATLAAGAEHPLLDIDLTVFIQLGLFLTMAFVATKLMFSPYLKMREERIAKTEGARAEAERLQAEAEGKLAEYEEKVAAARSRGADEQRKLRQEGVAHEQEVTAKARAAAQKSLDESREKVAAETAKAREELMPRADALAKDIVSKLIGREVA